ncbi:MAG: penicillin-binding protein activator LpoB [Candidatus Latescibacterota bacterium]|nr:penicillin-binding protein activator LpoB [Candidatus Latescibacterota bacterium]
MTTEDSNMARKPAGRRSVGRVAMLFGLVAMTTVACAGNRAFTRGTYEDPQEIAMLDDDWNQNDMQLVAKKIVSSLQQWIVRDELGSKPVIVVETPRNRTTEHLDLDALYDHVKTALIRSGQFAFLDKAARQEIAQEYEYQGSGYVDPNHAIGPGNQRAAEFLLGLEITSEVQQVGSRKVIYYKATFELTDIETTEIVWTDQKEIRKDFRKRSIGF